MINVLHFHPPLSLNSKPLLRGLFTKKNKKVSEIVEMDVKNIIIRDFVPPKHKILGKIIKAFQNILFS